ncbi:MAG: hypothetical protein M3T56_01930 [Chloroflexota bacterium]|nr:hypothetical protein [Chloroflexota bacterium]
MTSRLGWSLAVGYFLIAITATVLAKGNGEGMLDVLIAALLALGGSAIVGGLLVARLPRNPIGWLLLAVPLGVGTGDLADNLAVYGLITAPGSIPLAQFAGWVGMWLWLPCLMSLVFVLFLFPTGRLPSPRWRPTVWAIGIFFLVTTFLKAFGTPSSEPHPEIVNPFLIPALRPANAFANAVIWLYAVVFALGAASLVARYRHASRIEKQQLKWIVVAGFFWVVCIIATTIGPPPINFAWLLAMFALPVAIGIAILRHRLFDIDLLIKRTVVYGATTAAIAAVFFAGILAAQTLLRPLTAGSELAIAASTLASFALFQPARRRIQTIVDRRFDRHNYDAERTLDAFSTRLRDEIDLDALRGDLLSAVDRTMAPAHASLWLRMPTR